MKSSEERCEFCRFYNAKDMHAEHSRQPPRVWAECRRKAPVFYPNESSMFPIMYSDQWCGEFEITQ